MSEFETIDTFEDQLDRRREPRWELRGGVEAVCWTGEERFREDVALALIDVSAHGARLLVRDALVAGEMVEVYLYEVGKVGGFLRAARVAWSAPARGGHYFAGTQFETALEPEALDTLLRYCRPRPDGPEDCPIALPKRRHLAEEGDSLREALGTSRDTPGAGRAIV